MEIPKLAVAVLSVAVDFAWRMVGGWREFWLGTKQEDIFTWVVVDPYTFDLFVLCLKNREATPVTQEHARYIDLSSFIYNKGGLSRLFCT